MPSLYNPAAIYGFDVDCPAMRPSGIQPWRALKRGFLLLMT
ncbi:MAG: hypothetical protein VCD50_06645 [Alphaproteobacteria bacterium]